MTKNQSRELANAELRELLEWSESQRDLKMERWERMNYAIGGQFGGPLMAPQWLIDACLEPDYFDEYDGDWGCVDHARTISRATKLDFRFALLWLELSSTVETDAGKAMLRALAKAAHTRGFFLTYPPDLLSILL